MRANQTTLLEDKRICAACDSTTTQPDSRGNPHWLRWDGQWLCKRCHSRYVSSPMCHQKWSKIHTGRYSKRRILFGKKRITLKENPRTGYCSNCGKHSKRTEMHHINYRGNDPLKNAYELCDRCHGLTKR